MPQCAVMGWPGQTGQTSPAALSQTVITKSICGAPTAANSLQLLLRQTSVGSFIRRNVSSASGCTSPRGWLPAEWATKRPCPVLLSRASARMERAELCVQMNKTL